MAEYYLMPGTVNRAYRVTYTTDGASVVVSKAHVCALADAASLPSGKPITAIEQPVEDIGEVLVDVVLGNVVPGTVSDYRTLAKAQIDASWG